MIYFSPSDDDLRELHSFPTRRSSDLKDPATGKVLRRVESPLGEVAITEVDETSSVGTYSGTPGVKVGDRSEEHTSELQSQFHLVCRLLLEKKNSPRCSIREASQCQDT